MEMSSLRLFLTMDGLMTEATDLILSNNKNFAKDLNSAFKCERRKSSQDLTDLNSITLLRMSIAKSLKDRSQSEIIDSFSPKRKKSRRRKGSFSGEPDVDVKLLDTEFKTIDSSERHLINSAKTQNKFEAPENDLTNLMKEEYSSEEIVQSQSETNKAKANGDISSDFNASVKDTDEFTEHKSVEIGLKLAQRNFSDSIFENCSTYSLTCPEGLCERENSASSKEHFSDASKFSNDNTSKSDPNKLNHIHDKKRENTDYDNYSDDQISLRDSFFINVNNNDDNVSQNSIFSKSTDSSSVSRRSSMFSVSKEDKNSVSNEIKLDAEKLQLKSERKLSKKEKKKQKKKKSNDVTTYECPKCAVSYILSDKTSRTTARCLHCDLWKSVEPVFMKTEKQPWNTCRIC